MEEPKVLMVQSLAENPVICSQAELRRSKRLSQRAVRLFPHETESFRDAQSRLDDLRVTKRGHLAARIEMLRKSRNR